MIKGFITLVIVTLVYCNICYAYIPNHDYNEIPTNLAGHEHWNEATYVDNTDAVNADTASYVTIEEDEFNDKDYVKFSNDYVIDNSKDNQSSDGLRDIDEEEYSFVDTNVEDASYQEQEVSDNAEEVEYDLVDEQDEETDIQELTDEDLVSVDDEDEDDDEESASFVDSKQGFIRNVFRRSPSASSKGQTQQSSVPKPTPAPAARKSSNGFLGGILKRREPSAKSTGQRVSFGKRLVNFGQKVGKVASKVANSKVVQTLGKVAAVAAPIAGGALAANGIFKVLKNLPSKRSNDVQQSQQSQQTTIPTPPEDAPCEKDRELEREKFALLRRTKLSEIARKAREELKNKLAEAKEKQAEVRAAIKKLMEEVGPESFDIVPPPKLHTNPNLPWQYAGVHGNVDPKVVLDLIKDRVDEDKYRQRMNGFKNDDMEAIRYKVNNYDMHGKRYGVQPVYVHHAVEKESAVFDEAIDSSKGN